VINNIDIVLIGKVQRRCTKRLRGLEHSSDRLNDTLYIPILEMHRLYFDLIFCYKIVFGLVHVGLKFEDFFVALHLNRVYAYKLYKAHYCIFHS